MSKRDSRDPDRKAGVVVCRKNCGGDDEFLLVSSQKHKKSWVFPVGTVEKNESLKSAAIRECQEESGWIVKIPDETASAEIQDEFNNCFTFFKATAVEDTGDYESGREVIWVNKSDLKKFLPRIFSSVVDSLY